LTLETNTTIPESLYGTMNKGNTR